MCIIDILQAYDTGKKLENLIKSQMSEDIGKKEVRRGGGACAGGTRGLTCRRFPR
jgi:hypothetical protein